MGSPTPEPYAAIREALRDVPDFPKKGILFKDITPVLRNPALFSQLIDAMTQRYIGKSIDYIAAVEARGYLLASPMAYRLGAGLIPIRKPGKLPCKVHHVVYDLEYGSDRLEMHADAVEPGKRVLVVDDVLATGGTADATCRLIRAASGVVVEALFLLELEFLKGRERLKDVPVHSLLKI